MLSAGGVPGPFRCYRDPLVLAGTNASSERPRVLAARTRPIDVDWARSCVRIVQAVGCSEEGVHDGRGDGEQLVAAGVRVLGGGGDHERELAGRVGAIRDFPAP